MRSGLLMRCASYCTWSPRSRTIVVESVDDQCRIPATYGNLDSSCGVAALFAGSAVVESESGVALASGVVSEVGLTCAATGVDGFDSVPVPSAFFTAGSWD